MKTFLLVLTLLLASTGEQHSHEYGFSSVASSPAVAVFKMPELLPNDQQTDSDLNTAGIALTAPIHLTALAVIASATPPAPRQPVLAGNPIRGPPTARI